MAIGGYDTIYRVDDPLELRTQIIAALGWPQAVMEQDEAAPDIVYVYRDQASQLVWDDNTASAEQDTMVQIITGWETGYLTVVADKGSTELLREKFPNFQDAALPR